MSRGREWNVNCFFLRENHCVDAIEYHDGHVEDCPDFLNIHLTSVVWSGCIDMANKEVVRQKMCLGVCKSLFGRFSRW